MTHHVKVCCDSCPLQAVPGRETSLGLVIRDLSFLSPLSPPPASALQLIRSWLHENATHTNPFGALAQPRPCRTPPHPKGPKFPLSTGAKETQASPLILAKASRSLLTRGGPRVGGHQARGAWPLS